MTTRIRPLIGVAVIVIKDDLVLVGRRRNTHGHGTWQFPGGHLEFGESPEKCAKREVYEETGLSVRNLRRGPYTNDVYELENKHYVTLFVLADYESGKAVVKEPDKCDEWRWRCWADLPDPRFLSMENLLLQGFNPFG